MRVLVVHAHPGAESFSAAVLRAAVGGLQAVGHDVDVVDLYASGFQAAMTRPEREAYLTDQPIVSADVAHHAELVKEAEALVFVYPTWWAGLPAIMKGWLDRVLVQGVAFQLDPVTSRVKPRLGHVRRIVGITTYGSSPWYVHLVGDGGRRTLARTLRLVCRRRSRPMWLALYRMDTASEADRRSFLLSVRRRMARL